MNFPHQRFMMLAEVALGAAPIGIGIRGAGKAELAVLIESPQTA